MKILTVTFDTIFQQSNFFARCMMLANNLSTAKHIRVKYHHRGLHHVRESGDFESVKETIIIHSATSAVKEL